MKRKWGIALLAVIAACTTVAERTSTAASSPEATTSSVVAIATSTTVPITTSTSEPTTTTSLLAGNWADQPVITSANGGSTLGWWDGTSWMSVDQTTKLPIEGGEEFQVALLGTTDTRVRAVGTLTACGGIYGPKFDTQGVELDDFGPLGVPLDGDDSGRGFLNGVAISAPWNLTPRPVAQGEAHPDLEQLAEEILSEMGYETDRARIVQTVDADIEGDGEIETFVVVEQTELGNSGSDVYSLVFSVTPSMLAPTVIQSSVIPPDESGYPASFRLGAVADLNGDGVMEVVLHGVAWENSWVSVYELAGTVYERRLSAGCGV